MRIKHQYASISTPINADFQSQPNGSNFTGNERKLTMIFYKYSRWLKIHPHQTRRIWIFRKNIRLLISYYPKFSDKQIKQIVILLMSFHINSTLVLQDTPIDTLIKILTQRSPIINTVSQTLMFQIRGVSIENQCVAVPDVPNWGGCVNCGCPWILVIPNQILDFTDNFWTLIDKYWSHWS